MVDLVDDITFPALGLDQQVRYPGRFAHPLHPPAAVEVMPLGRYGPDIVSTPSVIRARPDVQRVQTTEILLDESKQIQPRAEQLRLHPRIHDCCCVRRELGRIHEDSTAFRIRVHPELEIPDAHHGWLWKSGKKLQDSGGGAVKPDVVIFV
ncbi:hypothetical protein BO71DRAFT_325630 [Aspergillus ellipticus CBS 707.79]|uniref:Uncharacterized protein n=1 Tax=Aspergillus ellipticus CBS 707.79 TaxID=1448320 RepID=A0A319DAD2_9EURO|nr:hypothetical protein BO71DRAFT_325630 [Aspergillus ellipticus CBS 707.79]